MSRLRAAARLLVSLGFNGVPAMAEDDVDVLVVGAGISGISAGYHLQTRCPEHSYAIVEARPRLGGTWDLFRYPGVRSDSDMHTLGFSFRPWTHEKSIADGPTILAYLQETAREYGIDRRIRFGQRAERADWSSAAARWTVQLRDEASGGLSTLRCAFLFVCSGYYDYAKGYQPDFPGQERFGGRIVHPQHWPQDLDHAGKRIVVIGSGATAVTLVPALAQKAAHVTMLQRSPSWIASLPSESPINRWLRRWLPLRFALWLTRWKNVLAEILLFQLAAADAPPAAGRRAQGAGTAGGHRHPFHPALQPVGAAPLLRARRRSVPGAAGGLRLGRDRPHRALHRERREAGLRREPGGRHRRQRDRPGGDRRQGRAACRRPPHRSGEHRQLQGPDVQRRAEHGEHLRLHQCLMDLEGRPDRPVRLPAAEPHAQERPAPMPAAGRGRRFGAAAVDRLLVRLTSSARPASCRGRPRPGRGS